MDRKRGPTAIPIGVSEMQAVKERIFEGGTWVEDAFEAPTNTPRENKRVRGEQFVSNHHLFVRSGQAPYGKCDGTLTGRCCGLSDLRSEVRVRSDSTILCRVESVMVGCRYVGRRRRLEVTVVMKEAL